MAFTDIYKMANRFGYVNYDGVNLPHHDAVKSASGTTYYTNLNAPCCQYNYSPSSWGNIKNAASGTGSEGWCASKAEFNEEIPSSNLVKLTFVSISANENNDIILRFSATNSGSADLEIKSVNYIRQLSCYSSESTTSTSYGFFVAIYENLATPIVITPSESAFIDITLSAGNISVVSQG